MITTMHKTGGEIFDALQLVRAELGVEYRKGPNSLGTGDTYRDKSYSFSWFISKKGEFIYIIKDLDTDKKKEEKTMTKEEALKKIEELKEFVEKCEENEKEIPKMNRAPLPDEQAAIVCPWKRGYSKPLWFDDVTSWLTFTREDTRISWGIFAYELAQLMYAREYLKINDEAIIEARKYAYCIFKVIYCVADASYEVASISASQSINENSRVWCFAEEEDAKKVRDYLNKYVAHVKKEMY